MGNFDTSTSHIPFRRLRRQERYVERTSLSITEEQIAACGSTAVDRNLQTRRRNGTETAALWRKRGRPPPYPRGPMKRSKFIVVGFLTIILSHAALAQQGGTEQERRACAGSAQRYCRATLDQGDFAVLGCLQQNRAKLTAACRKVLADHGQ